MTWTIALLLAILAGFVAALALLVRAEHRLARIERALRLRNEAIVSALSGARRHVQAISEERKPGSRLSVAKGNWPTQP